MKKPRPTAAMLAAGLEVLRRELETLRKRCRGCPHSRKPIGFDTACRGDRIEQGEDGSEALPLSSLPTAIPGTSSPNGDRRRDGAATCTRLLKSASHSSSLLPGVTMRNLLLVLLLALPSEAHPAAGIATGRQTVSDLSSLPVTAKDVDGTSVPRSVKTRLENLVNQTAGTVNLTSYLPAGYVTDGSVDYGTQLQTAVTAAMVAGVPLFLPPGKFLAAGQVALPNDGATPPKQKPLRVVGAGASMSGRGTGANGGTILDLRYAGTYGKILTSGLGLLEITGVTFIDGGGGTLPWLYTTNTTLHVHGNAFIGSKNGILCDQDAIILGGTTEVEGGGGLNDGFQGYGTVIRDNFFDHIRRAVYGRTFANGVIVRDNTVWSSSGSNLAGGAAIEFDNVAAGATQSDTGNVIAGNLIEVPSYPYAIKLGKAAMCTVSGNNIFDATATTLAAVRVEAAGQQNIIIDGYSPGAYPAISDAGTGTTHISINMGVHTAFGNPVDFTNGNPGANVAALLATGDGSTPWGSTLGVQPVVTRSSGYIPFRVMRSAAEGTAPGEDVWRVQYDGSIAQGPNAAAGGNYVGPFVNWWGGGRKWSGVGTLAGQTNGANMEQDSGPGGSYFDARNYAFRFNDQNAGPLRALIGGGADQIRFGPSATITSNAGIIFGTGTPEGVVTAPVGSFYGRRDGGAGTSFYVKESGTGNTGWIAK